MKYCRNAPQQRQRPMRLRPDSGSGGLGGILGGIFGRGNSRRMSTGEVVVKQVARSVAIR